MLFLKELFFFLWLTSTIQARYLLRRDDFVILSDLQTDLEDIESFENALSTFTGTSSVVKGLVKLQRTFNQDLNKTIGDISAATPMTDANAAQMLSYLNLSIKPALVQKMCPLLRLKASAIEQAGIQPSIRKGIFDTASAFDRLCVSLRMKVPATRQSAVTYLQTTFQDEMAVCNPWWSSSLVKQDL